MEERLHVHPGTSQCSAAAFIDGKRRVDEIAVLLHQPFRAVRVATFLICREREDDVAGWLEPLLLIANQIRDEDRGHRLIVAGASAEEVAVLLVEREWVAWPVATERGDHIQVREEQDGLGSAGT